MQDIFKSSFGDLTQLSPVSVLLRLVAALLAGVVVAWIYRRTHKLESVMPDSLPATLVLLSVLIAMVTQVIGDSVARAFSLVGALSIVRFRTVVRDTRDTAFVIFAVVTGMAVGSQHLWVALLGIVVAGLAAFAMSGNGSVLPNGTYELRVRVNPDRGVEELVGKVLDARVQRRRLIGFSTAKGNGCKEGTFEVRLIPGVSVEELTRALLETDGTQDVKVQKQE